ncbi:synaptotagmin-like protein 2 [Spea bombifrons]|uniref:synaptotagmin-like protein 2 n=1 Tax=Spea bombifrons TaxID=233779 RepID=UPI00234BCF01|nr:synaptotagmin-like protein 2 [Spea bombifrons]
MIDLSFLTEAEQEAILQVLQRDAELKKAEEDRIRHLENVIDDENELKYKSGQWFYEAKSKRHRDKIHGADLVRASIRKRKKPTTLAELSKSSKNKGKKSWVNSVNKDLFIPPEQRGVMEDSEDDLEDLRPTKVETNQSAKKVSFFPTDKEKDSLNNGTASPAKQRKNPFNSANLEEPDFENENHRPSLENGTGPVKDQQRTDNLSSKVKFGVKLPYPELNEGSQTPSAAVGSPKSVGQAPLPKPRKLLKNAQNGQSLDATGTSLKRGDSVNSTGKPRGILKRCSSSSSTDSENLRLAYNIDSKLALPVSPISEVGGKSAVTALDSSPESTADKLKQVRFSSKVLQKPPSPGLEPFTGREIGEFRILEPKLSQAEGHRAVHDHTTSSQNTVNVQDSMPSLDNGALVSVSTQRNILEDMDARVPSNASVNSDVEEALEDSTYSTGVENQTNILEKTVPELNLVLQTNSSTGPEPIYAQVKKMPKIPSTDTSTEFDMEDSHMAPRFIGQRGKIQNIGGMGQPLEFGKSYGGSGKTRNVVSPLSRTSQGPYTFLNEENEKPEDYKVNQAAFSGIQVVQMPEIERGSDASGSPHSLLEWKRPPMLRDETWNPSSATIGPRIYERSQEENAKARSDSSFDGTKFGTSYLEDTQHLGEPRGEKYMPVNRRIVREVEEDKPRSLVTLSPERPQLSRNSGDRLNVTFPRDYQREMSPKSANFKVMSLKDRIPDASVGERPNPTQFQNVRSFWNVEGKSPPSQDIDRSPSKTLDNMLNKSRLEKNLQPRSSREDSVDYLLPNSYGVLSEEEQTSHKVASWLAQTPAIYENEQADPAEQAGRSEEVVEEVQKSVSRQRVNDEEFSNALQKLREEASQIPQVPKMEKSTSSGDVKVLPVEESQIPGFKIKTATKMDYNSENNPLGLPPVEIIEKQVVSNRMASEDFKIGLEKLLAEHESLGDDDKIHEKPTKKSELNESNPTQNIMFNNEMNDSDGTVEKTSVSSRKGQDEFAASLKKPDIEVSMSPSGIDNHVDEESSEESGESFDYHPEEEVVGTNEPMKSSKAFKIGFEEFLDSERRTHEAEEVIEKTIVTKNDNLEFVSALNKLKTEASLPEDIPMVEQNIEFEKQGKEVSTKEVPENIGSVGKISSMVYGKDESEKTVKTQHSMNEATPVPVTEEAVVKDDVQTNENADFYKRLLQLQQEASDPLPQELDKQVASKSIEQNTKAEEPKDLTPDENITVSLFPNKEVYITKKVYSDIDLKQSSSEEFQDGETTKETSSDLSSPGETKSEPPNKPKERTLLDIYLASNARSRAKSSGSSADQTGSKRTSLGNVIYKKPVTESPDVSKPNSVDTKQGSEDSNPILTALRRSEAKALSKPLVEVAPTSPNQSQTDIPKEDVELGNPEVPTETSFSESQFSNPEKLKRLSQSVPSFLHEETDGRDTDSASESSFRIGRHKKSPSSLTNLSGSSGMASLSSVSGSVMSIYSGDFGSVDVKGNIQFAVDYVEQLKEFHVFVSQCKDLAVADVKKQRSDPYVKSYLLPDKAKMGKRKTAVKKKTLNPAYNEILRYKIEKNALLSQRLNLSVWHNDALGRNSFLGEVDIDLATWDWNNKQMNWYPLQPRTPAAGIGLENRGEMKLALKYVPAAVLGRGKTSVSGEVHIWIKDCSDLPLLRGNKINSFVKCTILPDTSRKSRQKTRTVDKTPNPHFNHTMVYDGFKAEDLREACVELTVWDHNRLTNHFLGGLRIGLGTGKSYGTVVDWMDSSIEESTVWEKMMSSPDTWIEAILPLRMLKVAKLVK